MAVLLFGSGPLEGREIIESLEKMAQLVEQAIDELEQFRAGSGNNQESPDRGSVIEPSTATTR
ncbi:hypothetical protein [Bradyrhizobium sp. AUGA SZCCT0283]|uniref:hypothetical protein n=1 Tax=Bradyrhizobium sp. AUGA SZCCT0283 TaxID=2807671 RepID=UPI001BAE1760|nr:hypothetical protein [Bradyrhizobium sp. AUGA SZCCT0283]MBR1275040.1 hypothetical protein [Bradyrhizobium sp. AUGA SZCCT0283]